MRFSRTTCFLSTHFLQHFAARHIRVCSAMSYVVHAVLQIHDERAAERLQVWFPSRQLTHRNLPSCCRAIPFPPIPGSTNFRQLLNSNSSAVHNSCWKGNDTENIHRVESILYIYIYIYTIPYRGILDRRTTTTTTTYLGRFAQKGLLIRGRFSISHSVY